MDTLLAILSGAVGMASLIVALFFLRFATRTRDSFFVLFSVAFALYGVSQFMLGWARGSDFEPLYYLPRLVTFGLIILAVAYKNRSGVGR